MINVHRIAELAGQVLYREKQFDGISQALNARFGPERKRDCCKTTCMSQCLPKA
jgi:hypothetical protein